MKVKAWKYTHTHTHTYTHTHTHTHTHTRAHTQTHTMQGHYTGTVNAMDQNNKQLFCMMLDFQIWRHHVWSSSHAKTCISNALTVYTHQIQISLCSIDISQTCTAILILSSRDSIILWLNFLHKFIIIFPLISALHHYDIMLTMTSCHITYIYTYCINFFFFFFLSVHSAEL